MGISAGFRERVMSRWLLPLILLPLTALALFGWLTFGHVAW